MDDVRFFVMSDADNFLGLIATVQSLRRMGHHEPVTVLDVGLSGAQRDALTTHNVECARLPQTEGQNPFLCAAFPLFLGPHGTIVCIDADVIVTQPLDPVFAAASSGMLCAAPDYLADRRFAEWQSTFDLSQPLRRQVYVNAGFVAFSTTHFPDLLSLVGVLPASPRPRTAVTAEPPAEPARPRRAQRDPHVRDRRRATLAVLGAVRDPGKAPAPARQGGGSTPPRVSVRRDADGSAPLDGEAEALATRSATQAAAHGLPGVPARVAHCAGSSHRAAAGAGTGVVTTRRPERGRDARTLCGELDQAGIPARGRRAAASSDEPSPAWVPCISSRCSAVGVAPCLPLASPRSRRCD